VTIHSALRRPAAGPFVGRVRESARLDAALEAAYRGRPRMLLVGGEAGVGKTRLVTEFTARAGAGGAATLVGGCIDLSSGDLPYAPVIDALRGLVRTAGLDAVRGIAGPVYERLRWILPFDTDGADAQPGGLHPSQHVLFDGVLRFLDRLGGAAPVVLVLEDLHWADCATLDLLTFLTHSVTDERILIVGTYRTSDLYPRHRLRAALAQWGPRVDRIELDRFGYDEMQAMIRGMLGATAGGDLVRRILDLSDGNPFLAEELLAAGAETWERRVPEQVREVVLARVETLSDTAQEVIRLAATAGRSVTHRLLAAVSELPERRLLEALRECVEHQVLLVDAAEQGYVFRHALTREAVHEGLIPGERQRIHAALGAAFTGDPSLGYPDAFRAAAERAYHWTEAGDAPRALAAAVEAALAAGSVFAFAEAHRQFERVLDLWPRVGDAEALAGQPYRDVLVEAADASHWAGQVDRAADLSRAALSLLDADEEPQRVVALKERLGRYLWESGDTAGSMRVYDEASQALASMESPELHASVRTAQATLLVLHGRYEAGLDRCREAVAVARRAGAVAVEGRALNAMGAALVMRGDIEAGVASLTAAVRIAGSSGRAEDLYRAYANLVHTLDTAGRLDEALEVAREGLDRARGDRIELPTLVGALQVNTAAVLHRLGRVAEAEDLTRTALELEVPGVIQFTLQVTSAEIAITRGRFADARRHLALARGIPFTSHVPQFVGGLQSAAAELAIWERDHPAARAAVEDGLRTVSQGQDAPIVLRLCALGLRAEGDERQRRAARRPREAGFPSPQRHVAGALVERARAVAAAFPGRPILTEMTVYLLLCEAEWARFEGRPRTDLWEEVAAAGTRLHRPYLAAYARFRQAEELAAGASAGPAATHLVRDAYRVLRGLGPGPLVEEVEMLARRVRVRLDAPEAAEPVDGADPFGLTSREREVLAEVTVGRTNRQIARALTISEKTVSVHVSNIISKLAVSNRRDAAVVAQRLGLVDAGAHRSREPGDPA
jgi:DNA-binding CsgD family transcriptional regulator/tetratricopeptide (TPR) repeat protein